MDAYDTIKWLEEQYDKLAKERELTPYNEWEGSYSQERLNAIVSCIKHLKSYTELTMADNKRKNSEIMGDDENS